MGRIKAIVVCNLMVGHTMGLLVSIEMKWSVGLLLPFTRGHIKSILLTRSGSRKVINIGQKLAEKESLGLNYITANHYQSQ